MYLYNYFLIEARIEVEIRQAELLLDIKKAPIIVEYRNFCFLLSTMMGAFHRGHSA